MDTAPEPRHTAEVRERLEARFPDLDPTVVEAAIRVAAAQITEPVLDFVPLLERAARERLTRARAGGITTDGQWGGSPGSPEARRPG